MRHFRLGFPPNLPNRPTFGLPFARRCASLLTLLIAFGPPVFAGGMSGPATTVESVRHLPGGQTLVELTGGHLDPDGCASTASVVIPVNSAYRDEMVAAVLLAKATHSTVRGWLSGCADVNGERHARLTNVVWE